MDPLFTDLARKQLGPQKPKPNKPKPTPGYPSSAPPVMGG